MSNLQEPVKTTVMSRQQMYSEYAAWLQRGNAGVLQPLRLEAGADIPAIAVAECTEGLRRLFGPGALQEAAPRALTLALDAVLPPEGYALAPVENGCRITGADGPGLLYGVFRFLLRLAAGEAAQDIAERSAPVVPRRVLNHWDNVSGDVERGYAGQSIFFADGRFAYSPERIRDYARLLASIGINVVAINNVNVTQASSHLIGAEMLPEVARLADIFRQYHIRIALAVHFESPKLLGGLNSTDPLHPEVIAWWREQTAEIYRHIPDLSGYLVKADSEFRGGPHAVNRTQAEGANVLAKALAPHGGVVYWRCFIYNCLQDWRDTGTDRPMAAYELFKALDGQFESNVILQIKNGPSDFQVREPNSPLLGNLRYTREALELQIAQEYTGQQIDLFNLAVQWQEILEAPVDEGVRLQDIIGSRIDTVAAVANVGNDENWTGHTLAQANLYAFGRLAWNPFLKAEDITREWVRLTFGNQPEVVEGVSGILMRSRAVYEKYNAPLGLCWMVNIHNHYGPSPEGYEYMKWGTYHRASLHAIGVDRTSRGTGFAKQYPPYLTRLFDDVDTCPEELLLYFHRLPYTHRLKNGKTLVQHVYDTHFEGVEDVEDFIARWNALEEYLPRQAFLSVAARLARQLENAVEWRDVLNTYFYRRTGIADEKGRRIYE